MTTALSTIEADAASIGGHVSPGRRLVETIRGHILERKGPAGEIGGAKGVLPAEIRSLRPESEAHHGS